MSKPESLTTSETASATSSASSVRERGASDGDAAAQAEQRERRKPRRVDDQAAPVRTQTAPADDDERGERDNREQRQLDERTECERRREQQRRDLICEPEETPAAFGVRAERRERDGRRRGAKENGVGGEQTGQGEHERAGGTGRERKRQRQDERNRPAPPGDAMLDVERRGDRRGEHHRRDRKQPRAREERDRKSTRLNSSHVSISYAVFCLKKKKVVVYGAVLRNISGVDVWCE